MSRALFTYFGALLMLSLAACGDDKAPAEDTAPVDSGCDESPVELQAEPGDGWTPAAGCEGPCADLDSGGLTYLDCYITADSAVWCRYEADCG